MPEVGGENHCSAHQLLTAVNRHVDREGHAPEDVAVPVLVKLVTRGLIIECRIDVISTGVGHHADEDPNAAGTPTILLEATPVRHTQVLNQSDHGAGFIRPDGSFMPLDAN